MHTLKLLAWVMVLGFSVHANAAETTATLTMSASSLVFDGEGLQAPDEAGNFAVGIKLPIRNVRASKCETSYLVVGLGNMSKAADDMSDADKKIIAHNKAIYTNLIASAKVGKLITLRFKNKPDYLAVRGGVIYAPYCTLSMDDPEGREGD